MPQPGARPTLVFMHPLGGSAETWKPVEERLAGEFRCVRLDLPGFGAAAAEGGLPVDAMADRVEQRVSEQVAGPWLLVGHSMSAKVALLVARRAADAAASAHPLAGLVLAAGSPPAPEPMEHEKRAQMLGWFAGDDGESRAQADGFVRDNVASALDRTLHEAAVRDVLRCSRHAWDAWLRRGSLEDLRERVGELSIPALVLAGAEDQALGEPVQRAHMLPHLPGARLEIVAGAAHLLPLEQPDRVSALIAAFAVGLDAEPEARMTGRTRTLLRVRGEPDDAYRPAVLDRTGLACLRRLLHLLLPMPDGIRIDLAAKLDRKLAEGVGDGWRFASLPPDAECYKRALATLDTASRQRHGSGFDALDDAAAQAIADAVASGTLAVAGGADNLSAAAMQLWLQEVRGDACQLFLTHPAVQARAGILAAATGGDAALRGFARIGAGEQEAWEPRFWRERA